MGHIFISYSHKDNNYAHKLADALQREGFDVWIDDRIDYGTEWPRVIQTQLDACDAFVVIVTQNAFESKWVQNEVARAGRKRKPLFPLLLQGDPWLSIEATQYIDVRGGSLPVSNFYSHLEKVTSRRAIERKTSSDLKNQSAGKHKRQPTDPSTAVVLRVSGFVDNPFADKVIKLFDGLDVYYFIEGSPLPTLSSVFAKHTIRYTAKCFWAADQIAKRLYPQVYRQELRMANFTPSDYELSEYGEDIVIFQLSRSSFKF